MHTVQNTDRARRYVVNIVNIHNKSVQNLETHITALHGTLQ